MIKVRTLIETIGTVKFKKFIANKFEIDMLYPVSKDTSTVALFNRWKGKDMFSWHKFTDDNDNVLEFYADYYIIKKAKSTNNYRLPIPRTINDFINDMNRLGIDLYWSEFIDLNFEPSDYLGKNEIGVYFSNLLNKIDKSNEIHY